MISIKLKKEFVKKSILTIKKYDKIIHDLHKLGVDLIEFNDESSSLRIESLGYIISNNDKNIQLINDDITWWIYEDVTKVIYVNGKSFNVEKLDDFIDWLFMYYK